MSRRNKTAPGVSPAGIPSAAVWLNHLPLSFHMVAIITAVLAVGLMIASVTTLGILQAHLVNQIDEQLAHTAPAVVKDVVNSVIKQRDAWLPSNYYVNVQTEVDSQAIVLISEVTKDRYGVPTPGQVAGPQDEVYAAISNPVTLPSDLEGGPAWRAVAVPIYHGDTQIGMGTVALPLIGLKETLHSMVWYLVISSLVLTLIGMMMAHYLVHRSLQPLRDIENKAGTIASGDLSQRLASLPTRTEIGSLAASLNKMLEHIETSFAMRKNSERKIRQFVSDASHELRTPLSTIRGYGELYRMGGVPPEAVDEVLARIESEARRMGTLVEDLLKLARMDEGRTMECGRIDAVKLAQAAALDLDALDPGRPVSVIDLDGQDVANRVWIWADADQLTQVLTNLCGNLVAYTPSGSPVEFALGYEGDFTVFEIRDHGPGVDPQSRERIFERFYRNDYSRSRASGGSGLGLAIVAAIIDAHQGSVEAVETPGGGLTIRLLVPTCEP